MNVIVAESPRPKAHELLNRIAAEAGAVIMNSTVPIYRDDDDLGADLDRTGLLFRIGSKHFVLTAAHGIKKYMKDDVWLYADVSPRTNKPIPLAQCMFHRTEVLKNSPDRDIVAIHLNQDAVDQFSPYRHFITLAECDQLVDPKPAFYMAAGIPVDSYRMEPVAEGPAMFFVGTIEAKPDMEHFDPHVHLSLAMDGPGRQSTVTGMVPAEIPPFEGMSGCGIWRVAPMTLPNFDSWDPSMVRLVAIQNRAKPGSHTIGTWFKHMVDRIIDDHPDLKPATEIEYKLGY